MRGVRTSRTTRISKSTAKHAVGHQHTTGESVEVPDTWNDAMNFERRPHRSVTGLFRLRRTSPLALVCVIILFWSQL